MPARAFRQRHDDAHGSSGAGEIVRVEPHGSLVVSVGAATDLAVDMAAAGVGILQFFEGWLQRFLARSALEAVLEEWWQPFSGPFLYYSGRGPVPPPLRAFLDFIKSPDQRADGAPVKTAS